jgi:hypothetical protein
MFERVSQVAEALATGMSRRGFLGSFGRWAGATALAMAGVLSTTGTAQAGPGKTCCLYMGIEGGPCYCTACIPLGGSCLPSPCGLGAQVIQTVRNCSQCKC